jgi:hypothetical protein
VPVCSVRGVSVDFIRGVIVGPFGTSVTLMMQRPSNELYTVNLARTYGDGEQAHDDNSMDPVDGSILWNEAMGALHKEVNALQLQAQGLERTVGSLQAHLVRSQSECEKRGEVIDKQNKKLAIAESINMQLDVEKCKIEVMSLLVLEPLHAQLWLACARTASSSLCRRTQLTCGDLAEGFGLFT